MGEARSGGGAVTIEEQVRLVRGVAMRMARQFGAEADDLEQAALLHFTRWPPAWEPGSGNETWYIKRAAVHAMVEYVRKLRHTRRLGHYGVYFCGLRPTDACCVPTQDRAVLGCEAREALRTLPGRWRRMLRLYYWGELTMLEVGERLGVTESRISQMHRAALRKLRVAMGVAA